MAAPIPSKLAIQPAEILRLVASQMAPPDQARMNRVGTSMQPVQAVLSKEKARRQALQQLQWSRLLPDQLSGNFGEDEALLQQFGVRTVDFTPAEEAAWTAALASLRAPPWC